jgi:hypothetical protein
LRPDTYALEFSRWGYLSRTVSGVVVEPGKMTDVDAALMLNPAVEDQRYGPSLGPRFFRAGSFARGRFELRYGLAKPASVRLEVFDIQGRAVRMLVNRRQPAGDYCSYWSGTDAEDVRVADGVYFARLACGRESTTRKLVVSSH